MSHVAYWVCVLAGAVGCTALCVAARRRPGRWTVVAARGLSLLLAADAAVFVATPVVEGNWGVSTSLPLALCDIALVVAAAACWWRRPLLVELTYFWGIAGSLQAVLTPDLSASFPHLEFFEFVVGHVAVVTAAVFLVVGLQLAPRTGAVARVFSLTLAYTALVGLADLLIGADYMFLRAPPRSWTLLSVLGPWPWYLVSASALALLLMLVLQAPFRRAARP